MTVPKGELVYRDDREVLTRNWVWRQCDKDKTTEKTRNIFIPIDVLGEVGRARADEIIHELSELIPRLLGGSIFSAVLNREKTSVEF
jgi:DNA/RNA-binding domain of Phe-tRNA-synthetase-like protein